MAITTTDRLGLKVWGDAGDQFTRSDMNVSHNNLEAKAAGYDQSGTRPGASAAYSGFFHWDGSSLSYCDGTSWYYVGKYGSVTSLDGVTSDGVSAEVARADHTHALDDSVVVTSKINNLAVTTGKINDLAVTTAKLADGGVTNVKIASDLDASKLTTGTLPAARIGTGAITTDRLDSGAVTEAKIGTGAVTTTKIGTLTTLTVSGPLSATTGTFTGTFNALAGTLYASSTNSSVGIGTTSPAYKLDVSGTGRFTGSVTTGALNSTTVTTTGNTSVGGTLSVTGDAAFDTDTLYVDITNDRVGINDSTPSYSLDVVGTFRATGDSLLQGTLGVSGAATLSSTLTVTGDANFDSGTLFVDVSTNRVGILDTTPSYSLDVNGTLRATGAAYMNSTLTVTNALAVDTDTLYVDTVNDRVGINDSTPTFSLDVAGDFRVTSTAHFNRDIVIGGDGGGDSLIYFYDDGSNSESGRYFGWDDSENRFFASHIIAANITGSAGSASTAGSAGYASSAGNADTVDSLHASSFYQGSGGTAGRRIIVSDSGPSGSGAVGDIWFEY